MYDSDKFICSTPISKNVTRLNQESLTYHEKQKYKNVINVERELLDSSRRLKRTTKLDHPICNSPIKDQSKTNLNRVTSSMTSVTSLADYSSIEKLRKLTISDNDYNGITDKSFLYKAGTSVKSTSIQAMLDHIPNHENTDPQVDVASIIDISDQDQLSLMISREISNQIPSNMGISEKTINFNELADLSFDIYSNSSTNLKPLDSCNSDYSKTSPVIANGKLSELSLIHSDYSKTTPLKNNGILPEPILDHSIDLQSKVLEWLAKIPTTETDEMSSICLKDSRENVAIDSSKNLWHLSFDNNRRHSNQNYDKENRMMSSRSRKEVKNKKKEKIIDEDESISYGASNVWTRGFKENSRHSSRLNIDNKSANSTLLGTLSTKEAIIKGFKQSLESIITDANPDLIGRDQLVDMTNQSYGFGTGANLPKSSGIGKHPVFSNHWSALDKSSQGQISKILQKNQMLQKILQDYRSSSNLNMSWIREVEMRIASNKEEVIDLVNSFNKSLTEYNNNLESMNYDNNRLRDIIVEQAAEIFNPYNRQTRFPHVPYR